MTSSEDRLLREALRLPTAARAALAASLLDSLDDSVDSGAEDAWAAEIAERVRQVDQGTVRLVPWSEVRRTIAGQ